MNKKYNFTLPILFAALVVVGMLVGAKLNPGGSTKSKNDEYYKIKEVLMNIDASYVEDIDDAKLIDDAVKSMINDLDPHSYYISKEELTAVNQDLQGDFDGIGIEFNIMNDTIMVVSPISGGPSEALGILSGDKIIRIDGENVAGVKIANSDVRKKLMGKKGTKVTIEILRSGERDLLEYTIVRDKIPIFSIDASYMVDNKIGYIKINRFSAKTVEEFLSAIKSLKSQGMEDLILDLRGNPGGYLQAAYSIADEFFDSKKLIVYTQGKARSKKEYYSSYRGNFKEGRLVVLIDEGSASASEILAGAIQDWDRGVIIGRRSFGKGLVQEQFELSDSSALRLTVAKYFTPSGRFIQKPYQKGHKDEYNMDVYHRFENGELMSEDSIHFPDSLIYTTKAGRKVYGGGGITPDIFIPMDTSLSSEFVNTVFRNGLPYRFVLEEIDSKRDYYTNTYKTVEDFNKRFNDSKFLNEFIKYANEKGVKGSVSVMVDADDILIHQLKAQAARQIFGNGAFYQIINQYNNEFIKAVEVLHDKDFDALYLSLLNNK